MTLKYKDKITETASNLLFHFGTVFPIAVCMFVCSGIGAINALPIILIFSFLTKRNGTAPAVPLYLNFLIISYIYGSFGGATTAVAIALSGILLCFAGFFEEKAKPFFESPAAAAIMLSTALTMTVMQTTNYFGIGATGNTSREMIASYLSLGFHPNWRGVLYGTIVLVIMITFPKKFKIFSKIIHPSFCALAVTLVLNCFLNPSDMATSIKEIGQTEFNALVGTDFMTEIISADVFSAVLCAIALFLSSLYMLVNSEKTSKGEYAASGITTVGLSFFGAFLPSKVTLNKSRFLKEEFISVIPVLILGFIFILFYERIPVASCAVVLIVGAWQSVKWRELKKVFSGIAPIICFTVSTVACLFFGIVHGVLLSAIVSVIYYFFLSKKKATDF